MFFGMRGTSFMRVYTTHRLLFGATLSKILLRKGAGPKRFFTNNNLKRVHRMVDLQPTLALIATTNPDVLCLNEVLKGVYGEHLIRELKTLGYKTFAWGVSPRYKAPIEYTHAHGNSTKRKGSNG